MECAKKRKCAKIKEIRNIWKIRKIGKISKKLENEENNEKRQYKSKVLSQERLKNLESSFSPKDRVKKWGWWSWVEPISL